MQRTQQLYFSRTQCLRGGREIQSLCPGPQRGQRRRYFESSQGVSEACDYLAGRGQRPANLSGSGRQTAGSAGWIQVGRVILQRRRVSNLSDLLSKVTNQFPRANRRI